MLFRRARDSASCEALTGPTTALVPHVRSTTDKQVFPDECLRFRRGKRHRERCRAPGRRCALGVPIDTSVITGAAEQVFFRGWAGAQDRLTSFINDLAETEWKVRSDHAQLTHSSVGDEGAQESGSDSYRPEHAVAPTVQRHVWPRFPGQRTAQGGKGAMKEVESIVWEQSQEPGRDGGPGEQEVSSCTASKRSFTAAHTPRLGRRPRGPARWARCERQPRGPPASPGLPGRSRDWAIPPVRVCPTVLSKRP